MFTQLPQPASNYYMPEESQLAIVFSLAPLQQSPTAPVGYTNQQMKRWNWLGGSGFLVLTRNDFGEHGILTELMYFPGLYQPQCTFSSAANNSTGGAAPGSVAAGVNFSNIVQERSTAADNNNSSPEDADSSSSSSSLLSSDNENDESSNGIYSAQRFWVDMQVSQAVGRAYFGYPKVSGVKAVVARGQQKQQYGQHVQ